MQQSEDYVLKVLRDVGLISRKQIDDARTRLDGQNSAVDILIKDGIVSQSDVSRSLDLDFAPIPEDRAATLRTLLTDRVTVANPFDTHTYL